MIVWTHWTAYRFKCTIVQFCREIERGRYEHIHSGVVAKGERLLLPCIDGAVWILEDAHYEVAIEFPTHASHFRSSQPTFSNFVIKTKNYTISNFLLPPDGVLSTIQFYFI